MSNDVVNSNDLEGWLALIEEHLRRYPTMRARDVYKLLYQGILGPEHLIPSAETFSTRLVDELASLQPDPNQPLLESIRPDGALNRIHLRPWLSTGRNISWLVEACLETGKLSWGTSQELSQLWHEFTERAKSGQFPAISGTQVRDLSDLLEEQNFPPVHHSTTYTSMYKPAYRLIGFLSYDQENPLRR